MNDLENYKEKIQFSKNAVMFLIAFGIVMLLVGVQNIPVFVCVCVLILSHIDKIDLYKELGNKQAQINTVIDENRIIKENWDRMYEENKKLTRVQ